MLPTVFKHYSGSTLAEELMENMNDGLYDDMIGKFRSNVEYNHVETHLNIELIELISVGDQRYGHVAEVKSFSDEDLLTDKWDGVKLGK